MSVSYIKQLQPANFKGYLRQRPDVLHDGVKVVKESRGSKDSVHDAGSEESVTKVAGGDDVQVGHNNSHMVKLTLNCHGGPVDCERHHVAPDKERGEVVENVLVMVPVGNIQKSLVPEQDTAESHDIHNDLVWKFYAL